MIIIWCWTLTFAYVVFKVRRRCLFASLSQDLIHSPKSLLATSGINSHVTSMFESNRGRRFVFSNINNTYMHQNKQPLTLFPVKLEHPNDAAAAQRRAILRGVIKKLLPHERRCSSFGNSAMCSRFDVFLEQQ